MKQDDLQGSAASSVTPDKNQIEEPKIPFGEAIQQYHKKLNFRKKPPGGSAYRTQHDPYREEQEAQKENYSEDKVKSSAVAAQSHFDKMSELQLRRGHLENEQFSENMALRREFANKVFYFVVGSALVVMYLIWGSGLKNFVEGPEGKLVDVFSLSDPVLLALISAVTINLMGALIIVVKYLFPTAPVAKRSKIKVDPTMK